MTPYLEDLQQEYFSAKELLHDREQLILQEIKQSIGENAKLLQELSDCIATIDCASLMTRHMQQWGWTMPSVDTDLPYKVVE